MRLLFSAVVCCCLLSSAPLSAQSGAFVGLPLKFVGADGSPLWAVLVVQRPHLHGE